MPSNISLTILPAPVFKKVQRGAGAEPFDFLFAHAVVQPDFLRMTVWSMNDARDLLIQRQTFQADHADAVRIADQVVIFRVRER